MLALLGGVLLFGSWETDPEPVAANMDAVSAEADTVRSADLPQVNATLPHRPNDRPAGSDRYQYADCDRHAGSHSNAATDRYTNTGTGRASTCSSRCRASGHTPVPIPAGPCHLAEQNGMLLIDIDSAPAAGGWVFENSAAGFFGDGYYTYRGEESPSTQQFLYSATRFISTIRASTKCTSGTTTTTRTRLKATTPGCKLVAACAHGETFSGFRDQWNWDNLFEPSQQPH